MKAKGQDQPAPVPEEDEAELIRKAQDDPKAFGRLYERYVRKIYTYVYYRTGNHVETEDLTSRVFQKAYVHMPHYRNQGLPFSAWLYRIAHNIVANWYRDQSRSRIVGLDETTPFSASSNPDDAAERNSEEGDLLKIIRGMPPERQQILILKFAEGYSNAEIGKMLGRSEGAIKSLYHRTLLVLRDEMDKRDARQ